jgi:hypothetical protein
VNLLETITVLYLGAKRMNETPSAPSFADPANLEPNSRGSSDELRGSALELKSNDTSLTLLQAIYRSPAIALMTRMRAAVAALQFEHPKLAVTANVEAGDFADQLENAIKRSRMVSPMIEAKPITDISANVPSETKPLVTNGVLKPSVVDRRFRKW